MRSAKESVKCESLLAQTGVSRVGRSARNARCAMSLALSTCGRLDRRCTRAKAGESAAMEW